MGAIPADIAQEALSFDQRRQGVQAALQATTTRPEQASSYAWVRDIYDDYFVYEQESPDGALLFRRDYAVAEDGTVTLGDPQQVRQTVSYEPVTESATGDVVEAEELGSDLIPLLERALREDGTFPLKVIQAGWGSSGFYSPEVLKRDGPKVFPAFTQMFIDHPGLSESRDRPERSIKDLAAVTVSAAEWQEDGPAGPGLYANARPFSNVAPLIEELSPFVGVSIRASGHAKPGEAEGRKGPVIERLVQGHSIDLVTKAGAGGKVLSLIESARPQPTTPKETTEVVTVDEAQIKALEESNRTLQEQVARMAERELLREAHALVAAEVARTGLPDMTKDRLITTLAGNPPVKDGALDRETYATRISEAVKTATAEVAAIVGSGQIHGMGASTQTTEVTAEEAEKQLVGALGVFGITEMAARSAVTNGR